MIIVDSSVWIQAFRVATSHERGEVARLLAQGEVALVGPVLAEVLQGARSREELEELQALLAALPYLSTTQDTWSQVGELSFQLRKDGISLALVDILIATLVIENDSTLYTMDEHFQRIPGVRLHKAEGS